MKFMANELYFSSKTIDAVKFKIIVSNNGIREILINKKSDPEQLSLKMTQIASDDT